MPSKAVAFFILFMALTSEGALLTFSGLIQGRELEFSVSSPVWDSYVQNEFRNNESHLLSFSNWSLIEDRVAPIHHDQVKSQVQRLIIAGPQSYSHFKYQEGISSTNVGLKEIWGHGLEIRADVPFFFRLEDVVGVPDFFTYHESWGFGTNYTSSGQTEATWKRESYTGYLTLSAYSQSEQSEAVPEPSTIALSLLGTVFIGWRLRSQKA